MLDFLFAMGGGGHGGWVGGRATLGRMDGWFYCRHLYQNVWTSSSECLKKSFEKHPSEAVLLYATSSRYEVIIINAQSAGLCSFLCTFLKCMSTVDWNNSASFFPPQIKLGGPSQ